MANNNQDFSATSSEASVLADESQEHATFTDSLVDQENVKSPQEEKDTIKELTDQVGVLRRRAGDLENKLHDSLLRTKTEEETSRRKDSEISELKMEIIQLKSRLEENSRMRENDGMKKGDSSGSEISLTLDELQVDYSELHHECLTLHSELEETRVENDSLRHKINSITSEMNSKESEREELNKQILSLQEDLKNTERRLALEDKEVKGELELLLYETKKAMKNGKGHLRSSIAVGNMSTDEIRSAISSSKQDKMYQSMETLDNIETKIKKFVIDNSVKKESLSQNQVQTCENARTDCREVIVCIEQTLTRLEAEVKRRNIRQSEIGRIERKAPDEEFESYFTGYNGPLNVYEFLNFFKSYIWYHQIPEEEAGYYILRLCGGEAKKTLKKKFHLQVNPNAEEIRDLLKKLYGNKRIILKSVIERHMVLGEIVLGNRTSKVDARRVLDITNEHISLLEKVNLLRVKNYDDEGNPIPEKLDIESYILSVRDIIPSEKVVEFMDKIISEDEDDDSRMNTVKETLEKIKTNAQHVLQSQIPDLTANESTVHNKDHLAINQHAHGGHYTFIAQTNGQWSENIDSDNCPLCKHLKQNYNYETEIKKHGMCNANGRVRVIIETCPNLVHLSVKEKNSFLVAHHFCRHCSLNALSPFHIEALCSFTENNPRRKCKIHQCQLRIELCFEHRDSQIETLSKRRDLFEKIGINFNF